MRLRLLCCDVFLRYACGIIAKSPNIVDVEFVPMLAHNEPERLRKELQERINAGVRVRNYDKLLLGYGLCGNTTAGLTCEIPVIIPRVHDCCAMFLGSRERFAEEFGDALSMRWSSNGYYERGHGDDNYNKHGFNAAYKTMPDYLQMIEQYGEENAEYIWETMHPKIETKEAAYIKIDGYEFNDSLENFRKSVAESGTGLRLINGATSFLEELINGPWDAERFLHVPAGKKITAVYDMETVFNAENIN